MSQATWKAEFYPKPASRVKKEDAVAHSIKKWKGLTRANLKRHGLKPDDMVVDRTNCALCHHYYAPEISCTNCPLAQVRGDIPCCYDRDDESINPCDAFYEEGKAQPMLKWLRKAEKLVQLNIKKRD